MLTSGQRASASEGAAQIRTLIGHAGDRIVVMPGAGIDSGNIAALRTATGATEFHASAKRTLPSAMRYQPNRLPDMRGGEMRSDRDESRRIVQALAR